MNRKAVRQIQNRMALSEVNGSSMTGGFDVDEYGRLYRPGSLPGEKIFVPADHNPRLNEQLAAMRQRRAEAMQSLGRFTEASYLTGKAERTTTKPPARTARQAEVDQSINLHEGRPPWLATR